MCTEKGPDYQLNPDMRTDPAKSKVEKTHVGSINGDILEALNRMEEVLNKLYLLARENMDIDMDKEPDEIESRDEFPPPLDFKYCGDVMKRSTGEQVPDDEWILFRATDHFLPNVLRLYHHMCQGQGCDPAMLRSVPDLIERVERWQSRNHHRVHLPD